MSPAAAHYLHSSARENVLEHLFIGEMLKALWCNGAYDVEVLRAETDDRGYHLVVECQGIIRHIQLKSTHRKGKASRQKINTKITSKPGGCVVWMLFDAEDLDLGPFRWFGGRPGQPMPSLGEKIAKHTKANAQGIKLERPNIRVLNKGRFEEVDAMEGLVRKLFGQIVNISGQQI